MNISKSISKSLEHENSRYHEEATCVDCKPEKKIKNGVWLRADQIKDLDLVGYPVYYNSKTGMTLYIPISHCLLTGSTGTGKSEVVIKNILSLNSKMKDEIKPSFLVTDLKGDLSGQLGQELEENGYNVRVLNMKDPFRSAKYNFLSQIYDDYHQAKKIKNSLDQGKIFFSYDKKSYETVEAARAAASIDYLHMLEGVERAIKELSHIIIPVNDADDKGWIDGARTMFCAIVTTMLHDSENPENNLTRDKFTIANVVRAAYTTDDDCEKIIKWLERVEHILCVKSALSSNYRLRGKATRDSYVTSLNTPLGDYTGSSIGSVTATSEDFDLRKIAESEKPYAIFIITDDRQKATNSISMMFINDLVNQLINVADQREDKSLARDFIVLADEFANMPKMPGLANKITTLRSRRIWLLMAIQSQKQLSMVYGDGLAEVIEDNCDLHLFVGCNNDETKESFARSMGCTIGTKTSFQISNDGSVSASKHSENVPVIRKSDLDKLELGQFYIRSRQSQNMKSYMTPFFMQANNKKSKSYDMPIRPYNPDDNVYDINEVVKRERPNTDFDDLF